MASPTIPDLPTATIVNDSDLIIVRQPGSAIGVDKKAVVSKVRQLNLAGLAPLPIEPLTSDLLLIQRGGTNYQIPFSHVSVPKGTKMWFYHNAASDVPGWGLFAVEDTLLAVKGGFEYSVGGTEGGQWQQKDHTLTLAQIPKHSHIVKGQGASSGTGNIVKGFKSNIGTSNDWSTKDAGSGAPHNHGDSWRPRASIGIILIKNLL